MPEERSDGATRRPQELLASRLRASAAGDHEETGRFGEAQHGLVSRFRSKE